MKLNATSLLGLFTCLVCSAILIIDMVLSAKEIYHFELKSWHMFAGYGVGLSLVVLPQDKISEIVEKIIKKRIR